MCIGGGPVGPQKYSGGSSSASTMDDDKQKDSEGNTFGSMAYHDKIRSDAAARRNESAMSSRERGTYGKTDKRTGSKSLISRIKSMF